MKIETARQSEETTLVIDDLLEIELRVIPGVVYIQLIPRKADRAWIIVRDWEGKERYMVIEAANQTILNQITQAIDIKE